MNFRMKSDNRSRRRERDDRRLTNLMFIIFISFVLCFLPLTFVNVFEKTINIPPAVHVISSILEWMSSVINPLIYAVSNRQYREAYAKLFNLMKTKMTYTESKQNSRPSVSDLPLKGSIIKNVPWLTIFMKTTSKLLWFYIRYEVLASGS